MNEHTYLREIIKSLKLSFTIAATYLLTTYLLSIHRTAKNISSYGSNKNFVSLIAYFVTQQTYCDNHILVSSCNVAFHITNIFASFANIQFHVKTIFPPKNYYFHNFSQQNDYIGPDLILTIISCMKNRRKFNDILR